MFKFLQLIILSFLWCNVQSDRVLVQTNVVYRHGDRSPIDIYPLDTHQVSEWPDGLGFLSEKGKQQHTRLGVYLRKRYPGLLKSKYDSSEIHVTSSEVDRTILSAYSNLAGLYADEDGVSWDGSFVEWHPVPVHTIPVKDDELLKLSRHCKKALTELAYMEGKSPDMLKMRDDMKLLIEMLAVKTGWPIDMSADDIDHIKDALFCEQQHNLKWPEWATFTNFTCPADSMLECANRTVFDILSQFQDNLYRLKFKSQTLLRFQGGPLLVKILDNLEQARSKKTTHKMLMYSAHDTTVAALLGAMGVFNNRLPPYTATVMVELYRLVAEDSSVSYQVEVNYKNVTDREEVYQLSLPECGSVCPLDTFISKYSHYRINNWDEDCKNREELFLGLTSEEVTIIGICTGSSALLILLLAVICYIRRRRTSPSYMRVATE